MKTYCFDIDGTICTTDCDYNESEPFKEVIKKINLLYHDGNRIVLFTSRGTKSGINWYDFTKTQLNEWGVDYHLLLMGKPQADIFIDDRAINIDDWCKQNSIKKKT